MTFVLIIGRTHYAIVSQRALICQYLNATCRLGRDMANEQIHLVDEQIAALKDVRGILTDFAAQCEKEGLDESCSLSFNMKPVLFDEDFFRED